MIELVDKHIVGQLERIERYPDPNGQPEVMKVHPYEPDRDKGDSVYPCWVLQRLYYRIDKTRARPTHRVWTPSEEVQTIKLTPVQAMGGPAEFTGPVSWVEKPYPIPTNWVYEIRLLATQKGQIDVLEPMIIPAFPVGYQPNIDGQYPLFDLGDGHNLDQLEIPLFERRWLLTVGEIWMELPQTATYGSIFTPVLEVGAEPANIQ